MAMPGATPWICPACRRHVPRHIEECRCGYVRAADAEPPPLPSAPYEPSAPKRRLPWDLVVIGLCCAAAGSLAMYRLMAPAEPEARSSAAPIVPAAGRAPAPIPPAKHEPAAVIPRPVVVAPATRPLAPPSTRRSDGWDIAPADPAPVAPHPTPAVVEPRRSEVDEARARGERQLVAAMQQLRGNAERLVAMVRDYELRCPTELSAPDCGSRLQHLVGVAVVVGRQLDEVDDLARQSWLEPGRVRDLREQYGLDDRAWDELARIVRQFAR